MHLSKIKVHIDGLQFVNRDIPDPLENKLAAHERRNFEKSTQLKKFKLQSLDDTNKLIEEKLGLLQGDGNRSLLLKSQLSISNIKSVHGMASGSSNKTYRDRGLNYSRAEVSFIKEPSRVKEISGVSPTPVGQIILVREKDRVVEVDIDKQLLGPVLWDIYHKLKKVYSYLGKSSERLKEVLNQYVSKSNLT